MKTCRVRFAPSPTGIMHIGNVRTALLNYLFALKNHGTFILRVEDTDQDRNIDPQISIFNHLTWLKLNYQEGPIVGGNFGPYFQSQRNEIYQTYLAKLQEGNFVYRCFCTQEQLEAKRNRQIALKLPPRYDRACTKLSHQDIEQKLQAQTPFFWRMKIDETQTMSFLDLGHGTLNFDLKNFSDFAISRTDGSFTFMFANCIDDITMQISHILRGEDHLTNTVGQLTIMKALQHQFPTFWHLPILCNTTGKKLSKRDQGFSLDDLKREGFLPQAILNYLGIIGGSFEKEILSIEQLAQAYNFDNIHTASQIKFDIEKMKWVNHKWIAQTPIDELMELCKPFLAVKYDLQNLSDAKLTALIQAVHTDIITLQDICNLLEFYFVAPSIEQEHIDTVICDQAISRKLQTIINAHCAANEFQPFFDAIKKDVTTAGIALKDLFTFVRLKITGNPKGLGMAQLEECLGFEELKKRICH